MKKPILLLSTLVLFFITTNAEAQLIKFGIGGGYTALTSSETFDNGYHYGGKIVVGVPVLPFSIAANIYNNPLSQELGGFTYESSFLSVGLGAEFNLLPGPIKPYLAAELLYTSIGETKVADIKVSDSESKTGLGLGAGAYFTLLPIIDLDLSAHYNMNSLLSSGDAMNSLHIRLNVLIGIL